MALDAGGGACQGGAAGATVLMGSNVAKEKVSALASRYMRMRAW